ncbi:MgtE-domain-containing protein [Basidiobolus meristosporus CBS 931.73]|uniref:MgtE-domain-containing protein n=1 Tax=Basidiobolus meristosporus CBS 931.73 TaxID=1314790 RepID=A0A1Y1Y608_9FUNG|nr:MgtE-domain-containing protein [Basidiobolus meristosporus CBS 931.73]|eukprot:ORX93136.1 MgtE-domain-containing protein [Basidiobolus meristosporus CBS 931.73]
MLPVSSKLGKREYQSYGEGNWNLILQAFPSLLCGMAGCIYAGWMLDEIQNWQVFVQISELFILVPILLNLKGNLEMNLAARLSTAANLGELDKPSSKRRSLIVGNMMLIQLQSVVVGGVAGCFSIFMANLINPSSNTAAEMLLVVTSSIMCASVSSLILGAFMCAVVIYSRKLNINPDNVASPLAASFGDIIALTLFAGFSRGFLVVIDTHICIVILILSLLTIPVWTHLILANEHVKGLLFVGWSPIFGALIISSFSGLVLERFINQYPELALYSPVLTGVAGNVASIYASRISTALHGARYENHSRAMMVLFGLNVPAQWLFLVSIVALGLGTGVVSIPLFILYTFTSVSLVAALLLLTEWLTFYLWNHRLDPDNYIMPIITAVGDLMGTVMLVFTLMSISDGW